MGVPKVISFINMKGGVGKTTTTINLADTLVRHFNKNILVIDMDPQFNASQALFTKFKTIGEYDSLRKQGRTIASIVMDYNGAGVSTKEKTLEHTDLVVQLYNDNSSLYMIPGDLELIDYESSRRGAERILSKYINEQIIPNYELDYIFIDTPATYSIYTQASLIASQYYIVPIAPDVFSSLGYSLLHRIMKKDFALEGHDLVNLGIVFTLTKNEKVGRENIVESFKGVEAFRTRITEHERIRTGKLSTLMYDMEATRCQTVQLAQEIIDKTN
ncbi:AAA family ATPase [Bacillus badius]|uniref:ParA family protein n=1 Tax=Bacillus badius TaxID=1455 RepID=UPI001CBDEE55|nr:AAA family ATPase [Bacillus badius]UAT31316.1 AAA family ATPase [Bacillus badius]